MTTVEQILSTLTASQASTWVAKYEYQDYGDGPWNQNAGVYSGAGPVFRWQHTLTGAWTQGAFSAGATLHYKSGYVDSEPTNRVSDYATLDVYGSFKPMKSTTLTLGIHNLTDRDPPLRYQSQVFQAGYDPRFASAVGRAYYLRASYDF